MNFNKNQANVDLLEKEMSEVQIPEGFTYQLPPNSFFVLKGEFLDYQKRSELTTRFWVDKSLSNPQGSVQGGIIAACFDDTFGPLGVLTCRKPILTVDMNIQYIRAVPLKEELFVVTKVVSQSRNMLFMRAEMFNQKGKLLAQASTNQLVK